MVTGAQNQIVIIIIFIRLYRYSWLQLHIETNVEITQITTNKSDLSDESNYFISFQKLRVIYVCHKITDQSWLVPCDQNLYSQVPKNKQCFPLTEGNIVMLPLSRVTLQCCHC